MALVGSPPIFVFVVVIAIGMAEIAFAELGDPPSQLAGWAASRRRRRGRILWQPARRARFALDAIGGGIGLIARQHAHDLIGTLGF
jgi:hypothetical protein